MSEFACSGCGVTYDPEERDAFTAFSVNQHNQQAIDFAVSTCPDCASEVVNRLAGWAHEQAREVER